MTKRSWCSTVDGRSPEVNLTKSELHSVQADRQEADGAELDSRVLDISLEQATVAQLWDHWAFHNWLFLLENVVFLNFQHVKCTVSRCYGVSVFFGYMIFIISSLLSPLSSSPPPCLLSSPLLSSPLLSSPLLSSPLLSSPLLSSPLLSSPLLVSPLLFSSLWSSSVSLLSLFCVVVVFFSVFVLSLLHLLRCCRCFCRRCSCCCWLLLLPSLCS